VARRAPAAAAALAGLALVAGCGGGSSRDDVQGYLKKANAIQAAATPSFKAANKAYAAVARGTLPDAAERRQVAAAETAIRSTRAKLAALHPPSQAGELQRRLLHVYDLNADLAHETTQLADYVPAAAAAIRPLARAQERLNTQLKAGSGAAGQARALTRYAAALGGVAGRLRALHPPPLLALSRDGQVKRLAKVRSLALQLRDAASGSDSQRVARLLLRFRRAGQSGSAAGGIPARSLRDYANRLRMITRAETDVRREQQRLEKTLR
jgi:hypothetical protein